MQPAFFASSAIDRMASGLSPARSSSFLGSPLMRNVMMTDIVHLSLGRALLRNVEARRGSRKAGRWCCGAVAAGGWTTVTDLSAFAELAALDHNLCVVGTLRGDCTIQASVVNAGVLEHPVRHGRVLGLVAAG